MAQRSTHRKRRIQKRLGHPSNLGVQPDSQTVRELRENRTRRYQERRATTFKGPTQRLPVPPSKRRSIKSSTQAAAVVGKTQRKQIRRQHHPLRKMETSPAANKARPLRRRRSNVGRPPTRPAQPSVRRGRITTSLQLMRLLVAGIGVALVSGFVITLIHPNQIKPDSLDADVLQFQEQSAARETPLPPPAPAFEKPGKELRQLKQEVRNLVDQEPDLETSLFFLNPDTEEFVSHRGTEVFPAASMIKLPILIAFFQEVDAGKVKLDEQLTMRPDLIVGEAGAMQFDTPGSQYDALQTADWMITISDNTATNMIIDRLGGQELLNRRFREWGLEHTQINQPLPDLEGTNTMSAKDLAILLAKVSQGELLTAHSRDRALEILRHTVTKTLLPQGIGPGAQIAHKTGDIGMAVGDAGLIDMPNGQRYVAGIVVKRPHNDPRAQALIRAISKLTYKVFSERPVPRATPAETRPTAGQSPQL